MYKLRDAKNREYRSKDKGTIGGHRRLKIYGKLDCASAQKHLARGNYVKHRVFFKDEATAIAAGYRPCASCMPEEYKEWKKQQELLKEVLGEDTDVG